MSEEKLYAVKNAKGLYLSFSADTLHRWREGQVDATTSQRIAHDLCTEYGGHVVTLVEEPEKVVISESVGDAIDSLINADNYVQAADTFNYLFASVKNKDFKRTMKAVRNGYTVKKKKKKYKVRVPETQASYYYKGSDGHVNASDTSGGLDKQFSDYELQKYGLDGERFMKEEVTDNEQ